MEHAAHELASHLELLEWDAQVDYSTGGVELRRKGSPPGKVVSGETPNSLTDVVDNIGEGVHRASSNP
jgi:hypothetical protein